MGYPYDDLQDPESEYQRLYQQFLESNSNDIPSVSLDENDPSVVKYRELYSQPDRGEALLNAHIAQKPSYGKYKSGFMDELGDAMMAIMFNDPKLANITQDSKYHRAYQDWQDQGKYIDDVRSELDRDRARELSGAKFDIQNKISGKRQEALEVRRQQIQADRMANHQAYLNDKDKTEERLRKQQEENVQLRKATLAGVNAQREFNRTLATDSANRAKEASLERKNKEDLARKEKVREMAQEKLEQDPRFSKLFIFDQKGNASLDPEADPSEVEILKTTRTALERQYLNSLLKGVLPE